MPYNSKARSERMKRQWENGREILVAAQKAAHTTPEARAKKSVVAKASWTPERRASFAKYRTGRRHSAETVAKMRESEHWLRVPGKRTKIELAIESLLKKIQAEYVGQYTAPGIRYFRWDFAVPAQRLLIEADGCFWHNCPLCGFSERPDKLATDIAKENAAAEQGYRLVRFWQHDIEGRLDWVEQELRRAIRH